MELGAWEPSISDGRYPVDFREAGGSVPQSLHHTYESVPYYFPELGKAPSRKASGASRAKRLGLPETGRVFLGSLLRGSTSLVP